MFSLSGLEQLRAFMQGRLVGTPDTHLLGYRVTQANSGSVVVRQPISPWFDIYEGFIDLTAVAESCIYVTTLTAIPPGTYIRTTNLSLRYLRACTTDDESVIARGRILHAGSSFTTVEVLIEDALGRAVAHATGSVATSPMDPPPPPLTHTLEPVEEPTYPTPDPWRRPRPPRTPSSGRGSSAFGDLLDVEFVEVSAGHTVSTMQTSEWFCRRHSEVGCGIIGTLGFVTASVMVPTVATEDERFVTINNTTSYLAGVAPNNRQLRAEVVIRSRRDEMLVTDIQVTDADGQPVMIGMATGLLVARRERSRARHAERVLLTVLFTDVVDSTNRARELGDKRWSELLDDHNAAVRRLLDTHRGHEVKTTGDGFLATFDSPTRALECAIAIQVAVHELGLELRAGLHTGECEVLAGDVAGVAVHVAARVQGVAAAGEILATSTVRDLVTGSSIALIERGVRELKGLDGDWVLFTVKP